MIANPDIIVAQLGITDDSQDEVITQFCAYADQWIQDYCNRNFEQATYTEYKTGTGQREIILDHSPVQSITELRLDTGAYYGDGNETPAPFSDATTLLQAGVDYTLKRDFAIRPGPGGTVTANWSASGIVYRIGGFWPLVTRQWELGRLSYNVTDVVGNIRVIYVAGYPSLSMPPALQMCANDLARLWYLKRKFTGTPASETLADYSYSLMSAVIGGWPEMGSIRQGLAPFRRLTV
jgi:hypothetical protein